MLQRDTYVFSELKITFYYYYFVVCAVYSFQLHRKQENNTCSKAMKKREKLTMQFQDAEKCLA